jgi:hypothetical protein
LPCISLKVKLLPEVWVCAIFPWLLHSLPIITSHHCSVVSLRPAVQSSAGGGSTATTLSLVCVLSLLFTHVRHPRGILAWPVLPV